jgi:uncharacterized protein (TIGR00299 family) protein
LPVTGYRLEAQVVRRGGIRGTKVNVLVEEAQPLRKYTDIVSMIAASDLEPAVQKDALEIFRRLGEVEAYLHHEPLEMVHFHEVGAVDSIVDIVGAVIGLHALDVSVIMSSAVNVGSGTVRAAHGLLPVPAPATLELLKGHPSYAGEVRMEMTTPTGAAIVTTLANRFGVLPLMRVEKVGYGAGGRELASMPNLLRLIVGDSEEPTTTARPAGEPHSREQRHEHHHTHHYEHHDEHHHAHHHHVA